MKRLVINCIIFFAIVFCVLIVLDKYYTKYYTQHLNVCQKPDWIFNHQQQTFDFAFMGNSRVYNMVDIVGMEKQLGKKGINLGVTGSNFSEQYLVLDQFYKKKNTIKTLILQVDMIGMDYTKIPFNLHFPTYMNLLNDEAVQEVYKENASLHKYLIWKYIPFARYMEFSNKYVLYKTIKGGFECKEYAVFDTLRGTTYENMKFKDSNRYRYWNVNPIDVKYLNKIIALCKQKETRVIFYTAPIYSKNRPYHLNCGNSIKTIKAIADSVGIPYFDFNGSHYLPGNDTLNFYDNFHMNETGSKVLCKDLADSLKTLIN